MVAQGVYASHPTISVNIVEASLIGRCEPDFRRRSEHATYAPASLS